MKKILLFIVMLIPFTCLSVNASSYKVKELIPIGTTATVDTEYFTYTNFIFNKDIDSKGNSRITFEGITNKTTKKIPISINILLFDKDKKNVGFVSYCSNLDFSSIYSTHEIRSNTTESFYIDVTKRYFESETDKKPGEDVKVYSAIDVKYISVLDDNQYCKTGGPTKYVGLTLEEIINGKTKTTKKEEKDQYETTLDIIAIIMEHKTIIIIAFTIIILLIVQGIILNSLYRHMYAKDSAFSYLPIGANYISFRLAFGSLVAKIYIIIYLFLTGVFVFIGNYYWAIGLVLTCLIGTFVDMIKLASKKYFMFTGEEVGNNSFIQTTKVDGNDEGISKFNISSPEVVVTANVSNTSNNSNDLLDIENSTEAVQNTNNNIDNNTNNNEGSDLSNLFK